MNINIFKNHELPAAALHFPRLEAAAASNWKFGASS
jgi:hypothetical protein